MVSKKISIRAVLLALCALVTAFTAGPGVAAAHSSHHNRAHHRRHAHEARAGKFHFTKATNPVGGVMFAAGSVWNRVVPLTAPVDPNSAAMVSGLATEAAAEANARTGPWIDTSSSSSPIYRVAPNQPNVIVQLDNPTAWWRVGLQSAFDSVPIPANAVPARGSDSEMVVWQPAANKMWEFFHMRLESDGWHAAWGGAMDNVSQSPGYYTSSSWPGALPQWGATATSLPVAAGIMTLPEIANGQVNHALSIDLPAPRAGVYTLPAERTDGTGSAPNSIPEGAHLRLDPRLNLAALHLSPFALMMARAAKRYGIIVRDQTHSGISFYTEDPTPVNPNLFYTNGTPNTTGPFQGQWPMAFLAQFPWSSLQVLQMNLQPSSG